MRLETHESEAAYRPTYFDAAEWSFIASACDRLIPSDALGPGAVDLHVPEFIDRHMHTPYAAGETWYRAGPFFEAAPEFGYQGGLSLRELLRTGIAATDRHCGSTYGGRPFSELTAGERDAVLSALECGEIALEGVPAKTFFAYLIGEVRAGYFADPCHGGNRGKAAWEMIGYPGMVSDYRDWIRVRDTAYAGPPVALSDREGSAS